MVRGFHFLFSSPKSSRPLISSGREVEVGPAFLTLEKMNSVCSLCVVSHVRSAQTPMSLACNSCGAYGQFQFVTCKYTQWYHYVTLGLGSIISIGRRRISQSGLQSSGTSDFEIHFGFGISVGGLKIVKEECLLLF